MFTVSGLVHGPACVHANDGRDVDGRLPVGVGRSSRRKHFVRRLKRRHRPRRSQLSLQQGQRTQDSRGEKYSFVYFLGRLNSQIQKVFSYVKNIVGIIDAKQRLKWNVILFWKTLDNILVFMFSSVFLFNCCFKYSGGRSKVSYSMIFESRKHINEIELEYWTGLSLFIRWTVLRKLTTTKWD